MDDNGGNALADIDRIQIGHEATITEQITSDRIEAMARLTGDDNPVHVDLAQSLALGQSRPVAHGLILLGMLSRLIGTRLPGPGSVWFENQVDFLAPVHAGDDVQVTVRVAHISRATNVVVLDVEGSKVGGVAVLRGRAKVRAPSPVVKGHKPMRDCEKVALVTGGSRGVGRSVAEALGQRGIRVVVNYRTDQAGADACLAAVREHGGEAITVAANIAEHDGARRLFDRAIEQFGHVDVIVHSATPPIAYQPYLETSADEFRRYFETYVLGLHELARLAAPGMKERQYGRIVALLSSAISEVPSKMAAYIAGKYALLGLCRALAVELGPWGIGVNTVTPSMIVGPHAEAAGVAAREIVARKTPLRRLGQVEDVARAVLFLISDDAAFVSGANLPVTGGIFV